MTITHVNGIDLYYETFGDPANPLLVIVPGLGDAVGKCSWQTADLARDYYLIVPELRGSGRSSTPTASYSTADMGADIAALLDSLGVSAADVFAFSLGGMAALHLALDRPDLVGRLALGCTTAGGELSFSPKDDVLLALFNPSGTGDRRADYLAGVWISCSPEFIDDNPEAVAELGDLATEVEQTADGYAGQLQAVQGHDVVGRLGTLDLPVLVMHGDADLMVPFENGRALAEAIPGAQLVRYAGAGHLFFVEQAEQVNADLRRFFSPRR